MHALWIRLPVLVQAIVSGLAVAAAGTIPWAALVAANIEQQPNLPWAPVLAILGTGSLFGLVHFTHAEVTPALLPYYMAVAAVYGTLAHLTDSTLPSMALHGAGNAFSARRLGIHGPR